MEVNRVLDFSITPNTITSMTSSVPGNTKTYQAPFVGSKRKADSIDTYVDEFNIFSEESMRELYTRVCHSRSGKFRICLPCFEQYTPTLAEKYPDINDETVACGEGKLFSVQGLRFSIRTELHDMQAHGRQHRRDDQPRIF